MQITSFFFSEFRGVNSRAAFFTRGIYSAVQTLYE